MKPYGIPRVDEAEWPDIGDIQRFGFASHVGQLPGKSGDFHPYIRGNHKARVRRYWKRLARRFGKSQINDAIREMERTGDE